MRKFLTSCLVLFFVALFSSTNIYAAPSVTLTTVPDSVSLGDTFPISFVVSNADIGASYNAKAIGGPGEATSNIHTLLNNSDNNCNGSWSNCPIFIADNSGNISATLYAKTVDQIGTYTVKLRLHLSTNYDSPPDSFIVVQPAPTLTPTSSPTPTSTITPAPTNTPTPGPSIKINDFPSSVKINQPFTLTFTLTNPSAKEFYLKVFGGIGDNYGFETRSSDGWLSYTDSWSSFPTASYLANTITARVKSNQSTGTFQLKIRAHSTDSSLDFDADAKSLSVVADPTSTPALTTSTPTVLLSPAATISATTTIMPTITDIIEPDSTNSSIAGITTAANPTPVATPSPTKSKFNLQPFALVFIVIGGLLLMMPLVILKHHHGQKTD